VLRVSVRRIMTDLPSRAPAESQEFYRRVSRLGAGDRPRLDREPGRPRPARGPSQPVEPRRVRTRAAGIVSVEIDDVEASVRRFIACDPDGKVVYVLSHR
jgi:hypothetical protein